MSYSDDESDAVEASEQDARLREYWSKKARRRSSEFKKPIGDHLGLQENPKIQSLLAKNGEGPHAL